MGQALESRSRIAICLLIAIASGCGTTESRQLAPGARAIGSSSANASSPVTIDALGGFLGGGYLLTREKSSGTTIERTEHLLQERLGLGAAGTVYSPNFVQYEATGVVGPSQAWAENSSDSTHDTGTLYEGEANARLFPYRWHPANLYYSRLQDFEPRLFLSRLESTTTTARGTQEFLGTDGSLRIEGSQRQVEQTVFGAGETDAPFLNVTENTAGASGDYRLSKHQTVNASYTYRDVKQTVTENSFSAHDALGNHILTLGETNAYQLRSRVEGTRQEGSLDQRLLRVDEIFDSRLTDSLRSDAQFHFEKNDTNLLDLQLIRGSAGLRHQLFESLGTSVSALGGRETTNGESTTDTVGGIGALNYHKTTPLGILRMSSSTFLERRIVTNSQGGAVDEMHTFPLVPPEEIRLFRSQIDRGSIVITDSTGVIFYLEGPDYTVAQDTSGFTTITRVFTGNIPIGGEILIDYVFRNGSDYTLDTLSEVFRLEHESHRGVTPYFGLNYQDQNALDVTGPGGLEPIRERSLTGGLEWRRPAFVLGGEYENRESTVIPFDAVRLKAQGNLQVGDYNQIVGNVTQSWIAYAGPDRDVSVLQGTLRWRTMFAKRTSFFVDGAVRYEDDSLQGSSFGFGASGGVEYRWRKFSFRLRASHREARGTSSNFKGEEVGLWLVREFGAPPPSASSARERFLRQ